MLQHGTTWSRLRYSVTAWIIPYIVFNASSVNLQMESWILWPHVHSHVLNDSITNMEVAESNDWKCILYIACCSAFKTSVCPSGQPSSHHDDAISIDPRACGAPRNLLAAFLHTAASATCISMPRRRKKSTQIYFLCVSIGNNLICWEKSN